MINVNAYGTTISELVSENSMKSGVHLRVVELSEQVIEYKMQIEK